MVLLSSEQVTALSKPRRRCPRSCTGPCRRRCRPRPSGCRGSEIAYVGPSVMTSVANVRETPYLTSAQVTGVPSSNVTPSRSVNDHGVASSFGVPRSVAMSGTIVGAVGAVARTCTASACAWCSPVKNAMSSPVYMRCGSTCCNCSALRQHRDRAALGAAVAARAPLAAALPSELLLPPPQAASASAPTDDHCRQAQAVVDGLTHMFPPCRGPQCCARSCPGRTDRGFRSV